MGGGREWDVRSAFEVRLQFYWLSMKICWKEKQMSNYAPSGKTYNRFDGFVDYQSDWMIVDQRREVEGEEDQYFQRKSLPE